MSGTWISIGRPPCGRAFAVSVASWAMATARTMDSPRPVDIGPTAAALWLRQHGNRYGLCQIYANEMWHYELATEPGGICPRPIADASAG